MAQDPLAPALARRECDQLIDHAVRGARRLLEQDGTFSPFALVLEAGGAMEVLVPQANDGSGSPESDLDALLDSLRDEAEAGAHRAVAVVLNAAIGAEGGPTRDAVAVIVDHRDHCALESYHFYAIEERHGDLAIARDVRWLENQTIDSQSMIFDPQ